MKKNLVMIGLLCLMVFVVVSMQKNYSNLEQELMETRDTLVKVYDHITLLEASNKEDEDLYLETIETLEDEVSVFEDMFRNWYTYDSDLRQGILKASYDVEALVHTDDYSFPLPENGKIYTDSSFVEIEFKATLPPDLRNEELNNFIHHYDSVFDDIHDLNGGVITIENNTMKIRFDDLKVGDTYSFNVLDGLYQLLNGDFFFIGEIFD